MAGPRKFGFPHNAWVGGELSLAILQALVNKGVLTKDEASTMLNEVADSLSQNAQGESGNAGIALRKTPIA